MSELPPNTENIQIAQQLSELSIVYTKFRATKGPPMKLIKVFKSIPTICWGKHHISIPPMELHIPSTRLQARHGADGLQAHFLLRLQFPQQLTEHLQHRGAQHRELPGDPRVATPRREHELFGRLLTSCRWGVGCRWVGRGCRAMWQPLEGGGQIKDLSDWFEWLLSKSEDSPMNSLK